MDGQMDRQVDRSCASWWLQRCISFPLRFDLGFLLILVMLHAMFGFPLFSFWGPTLFAGYHDMFPGQINVDSCRIILIPVAQGVNLHFGCFSPNCCLSSRFTRYPACCFLAGYVFSHSDCLWSSESPVASPTEDRWSLGGNETMTTTFVGRI